MSDAQQETRERVALFNRHLTALADDAGVELDKDDRQWIFDQSLAAGFNDTSTVAAFSQIVSDDEDYQEEEDDEMFDDDEEEELSPGMQALADDLQADVARMEGKLGRPMLAGEKETYWRGAVDQVNRTGGYDSDKLQSEVGARDYGSMSRDEVNEHMASRARELDPAGEPDPDRVFDIHNNRQDCTDFMVERIQNGTEFHDVETVESQEGE